MANKSSLMLAGNWKLNPTNLSDAKRLAKSIIKQAAAVRGIEFVVCPPDLYLAPIKNDYRGKKIRFGAQNLYPAESGAHTGATSPVQLIDLGTTHVIVGHSERRAPISEGGADETDQVVSAKIQSALKFGLTPIVCIGEPKRDPNGEHLRFIETQIKQTFAGLSGKQMTDLIIAYEPVWAIGGQASNAITGHNLHEMMLYIRKVAMQLWGSSVANRLTILYGGSVKPVNAYELSINGNMDGFLVGGASLSADSFVDIAKEMVRAAKA